MFSNYNDGMSKENYELRQQIKQSRNIIYFLVKQLGGRVTISDRDLFDQAIEEDKKFLKIYLDGDMNRVVEAR